MSLSYLFLEKNALNNRLFPSLIKGLGEFEQIFYFKHHMLMKKLVPKILNLGKFKDIAALKLNF